MEWNINLDIGKCMKRSRFSGTQFLKVFEKRAFTLVIKKYLWMNEWRIPAWLRLNFPTIFLFFAYFSFPKFFPFRLFRILILLLHFENLFACPVRTWECTFVSGVPDRRNLCDYDYLNMTTGITEKVIRCYKLPKCLAGQVFQNVKTKVSNSSVWI